MAKNTLFFLILIFLFLGCATDRHREEIVYENGKLQKYLYLDDLRGRKNKGPEDTSVFLDVIDIIKRSDANALPELRDLPLTKSNLKERKRTRSYTGIIQNYSNYEVTVPSVNSSAVLIVPAQGWLEYVVWSPSIHLAGYVEGKQIYQQKIVVQPKKFKYMGKEYDFVAEIKPLAPVKDPVPKTIPSRKKRRVLKG
ncbi:MAG: hypothetical protein Q8M54_05325 [Desulfobaccales bacterium]|nr:hypothetical protein [Desulfobaccales bacterium]